VLSSDPPCCSSRPRSCLALGLYLLEALVCHSLLPQYGILRYWAKVGKLILLYILTPLYITSDLRTLSIFCSRHILIPFVWWLSPKYGRLLIEGQLFYWISFTLRLFLYNYREACSSNGVDTLLCRQVRSNHAHSSTLYCSFGRLLDNPPPLYESKRIRILKLLFEKISFVITIYILTNYYDRRK